MSEVGRRTTDPVRGSSLLLVGRVFSILVNTAFQVVLVRYLTQADYGVLAFGLSVGSLVQVVVSLGQERSISRFIVFYEEEDRPDRVLGTLVLYLISVAVLGAVAFVTVLALGDVLVGGLGQDAASIVIALLVLLAMLDSIDMMMQATFAAFAQTRSIFLKKYIVNPLIKLVGVVAAAATGQSIQFVALTLVLTSMIGIAIYAVNLPDRLTERGIRYRPLRQNIELPVKDVLRFSLPLVSSPMVFIAFMFGSVTILAYYFDSVAVAAYRAVWPAARLNMVVSSTFSVLFLPTLARLVSRREQEAIRAAYWRTSAWVAMLSLPAFLLTVPLASSTTVLLFGDRYASSASVLAIVSIGMYTDVIFGFNRQTLELYGRVWWVVSTDAIAIVVHLLLSVLLVPGGGPRGAAVAMTLALVSRNALNQAVVVRLTDVTWFDGHYLNVYGCIAGSWAVTWISASVIGSPAPVSWSVAGASTLLALRLNREQLDVVATFPELQKIPLLRGWLR